MKAIQGPDNQADERMIASRVHAPAPADGPAAAGAAPVHGGDARLTHGHAAAAGLMALQRSAGNAAVAALVGERPPVQREVKIEEVSSSVETGGTQPTAQAGATPAGAGGTQPTAQAGATPGPAGPVTSDGGTTTITGGHITLDTPITETAGVIRADTIIADNVIGSNYTPGAGNVW